MIHIFWEFIWVARHIPTISLICLFEPFYYLDRICLSDPAIDFFPRLLSTHNFLHIQLYPHRFCYHSRNSRNILKPLFTVPRQRSVLKPRCSAPPYYYRLKSSRNWSPFQSHSIFLMQTSLSSTPKINHMNNPKTSASIQNQLSRNTKQWQTTKLCNLDLHWLQRLLIVKNHIGILDSFEFIN